MSKPRGSKGTKKDKANQGRAKTGLDLLDTPNEPNTPTGSDNPSDEESKRKAEKERAKLLRKLAKSPRSTVREQLPKVLVAVVTQAATGSCPHAKLLLDFADAGSLPDAKEQKSSESLTELLLKEITKS